MKSNVDRMIDQLSPDIDRKCQELQAARRARIQSRAFILLCAMIVLIPALLVFAGVSITLLIAPPAFMSLCVLLLLPVLLSGKTENQGGIVYEQV
ncbi:MAG: hypothetical protein Q4D43_05725 [Clostridia bacterium]|nr:hypothetical protein [Clostridia bacterium]